MTERQSVLPYEVLSDQEPAPPLLCDDPSVVWGISLTGRNLLIDDIDPTEEVHMRTAVCQAPYSSDSW
jgi:hypothetical protein